MLSSNPSFFLHPPHPPSSLAAPQSNVSTVNLQIPVLTHRKKKKKQKKTPAFASRNAHIEVSPSRTTVIQLKRQRESKHHEKKQTCESYMLMMPCVSK